MTSCCKFKKRCDKSWERNEKHYIATRDALKYFESKYKKLYPTATVEVYAKDNWMDPDQYVCIEIIFKNKADEALFILKEGSK